MEKAVDGQVEIVYTNDRHFRFVPWSSATALPQGLPFYTFSAPSAEWQVGYAMFFDLLRVGHLW